MFMRNVILILALFISTLSFAKDDLKRCESYRHKVLTPAVTFEERSPDHGYRFVKDERKALGFISKFDVRELQLEENKKKFEKVKDSCVVDQTAYCNNSAPAFDFLRGLSYGLKNYDWSPKTKNQALDKIWKYNRKIIDSKPNLLQLMMVTSLLNTLAHDGLIEKPTALQISTLYKELEMKDEKLREETKNTKSSDCQANKEIYLKEKNLLEAYSEKLKALI